MSHLSEGAPILSPDALLQEDQLRREWVTLKSGRVCVWELPLPELMRITEKASRPPIDPRGGVDSTESVLWQIILSCYDGDAAGARRIFDEHNPQHVRAIHKMGGQDSKKLLQAIAKVNGASESEVSALTDFTAAPMAAMP